MMMMMMMMMMRGRKSSCNKMMGAALLLAMCLMTVMKGSRAEKAGAAAALFVFGDSLVDVGNNNHLPLSIAKANFPHNGLDFPTHKPTGRFSNGKNAADFLAEKLGLPSSPPYLQLTSNKFRKPNFPTTGVSFASGGAGIFDGTDHLYRQSITMNKQVELFGRVQKRMVEDLGEDKAREIISGAVIAIVIGSNDILGYFGSSPSDQLKKGSPQQYVDSMVVAIKAQLQRIYEIGGRKFVMVGTGAVGCCPSQRDRNKTDSCNEAANFWSSKYNQALLPVLQQFQSQLNGFHFTLLDTYNLMLDLILNPTPHGFKEVKAACCGYGGNLNAKVACLPISQYCHNRSDHVFWDLYHPTEAVARIVIDKVFDGSHQYSTPINIHQLLSL